MKWRLALVLSLQLFASVRGEPFKIESLGPEQTIAWSGAFLSGICEIQSAASSSGPWAPLMNAYTLSSPGSTQVPAPSADRYYRLIALDLTPGAGGFQNLCNAYGVIRTVAGKGEFSADGFNGWQPQFEGGPATAAELSRPHIAMADDAANIYIVDKDGQAIRKVTPAGFIVTVAGTNVEGDDGDTPGPGTQRRLSSPNGLWVRGDSTVYILDQGNAKIRKLDTNGVLTTLFKVGSGIDVGRGLWVKDDESLVYFASGTAVRRWTPDNGIKTIANGFNDLGNLIVDPSGALVVTDRGDNRVFRVSKSGNKTVLAGNGTPSGGGDGQSALDTGLAEVRGIWFLPTSGYLLATHAGSQIWYVDTQGVIHLFVDGSPGAHDGDGQYFRTTGPKLSEVRAVTMDRLGRIIITENDSGYVRVIEFLPVPH